MVDIGIGNVVWVDSGLDKFREEQEVTNSGIYSFYNLCVPQNNNKYDASNKYGQIK